MSFGHRHGRHHNNIKFLDDTQVSDIEYKVITKTETVNTYGGPRFPNLNMMFKRGEKEEMKTVQESFDDGKVVYKSTYEEENIDTEAGEFIKRKHQAMNLQKLMSMNAS